MWYAPVSRVSGKRDTAYMRQSVRCQSIMSNLAAPASFQQCFACLFLFQLSMFGETLLNRRLKTVQVGLSVRLFSSSNVLNPNPFRPGLPSGCKAAGSISPCLLDSDSSSKYSHPRNRHQTNWESKGTKKKQYSTRSSEEKACLVGQILSTRALLKPSVPKK